jgi:biotin carboxylase
MLGTYLFLDPGADVTRRDIYKQAHRLGMRVVLIKPRATWELDVVDDHLSADPADENAVLEALRDRRDLSIDGLVNCSEPYVLPAARVQVALGIGGLGVERALVCRDKVRMHDAFRAAALPTARRFVVRHRGDLDRAWEVVGAPGVLKPSTGVSSLMTVRYDSREELYDWHGAIERQVATESPALRNMEWCWLVEEFLDGDAFSVESVVDRDIEHVAICRKAPMTPPFFREEGHSTPPDLNPKIQGALCAYAERAIRALSLSRVVTHTEFKVTSSGIRILELGARVGGGSIRQVVQLTTGIDLIDVVLRQAAGMSPAIRRRDPEAPAAASRSLFPRQEGVVRSLTGLDSIVHNSHIRHVNRWLGVGRAYRLPPEGYDEVLGVVAVGATPREAIHCAEAAVARINVDFDELSAKSP